MIPHTLKIKNFLSYGPEIQTIDFGKHPLICLSGKNGQGKSALLDAITWAIWGQARKIGSATKADAGLLRLGQTQMMVALDFSFNGNVYRIRREYAKTHSKPYVALDFGMLDSELDHVMPLTEKTLRATQAKIENTLGLDFESFINSAFLRQGQANEFSKKSPKDRKEILAAILGLGRFEQLRKAALEKIKSAHNEQKSIQKLQEHLQQELAEKEEVNENIKECLASLKILLTKESTIKEKEDALTTQIEALKKQQQEASLLVFQHERITKDETEHWNTLRTIKKKWSEVNRLSKADTDDKTVQQKKAALQKQINLEQKKQERYFFLKEKVVQLKEKINACAETLQKKHRHIINEKTVLFERLQAQADALSEQLHKHEQQQKINKAKIDTLSLQKSELVKSIARIPVLKDYETQEAQLKKREHYYQKYKAQLSTLAREHEALVQKTLLHLDSNNPSCPVCEQNVSAARKRFLKKLYQDQEILLNLRIEKLKRVIQKLHSLCLKQEELLQQSREHKKNITAKRATLDALTTTQNEASNTGQTLEKQLHELQEKQKALVKQQRQEKKELDNLCTTEKNIVHDNREYREMHNELAGTAREIKALDYNATRSHELLQQMNSVEQKLANHVERLKQQALQGQRKENMSQLVDELRILKKEKASFTEKLSHYLPVTKKLQKADQTIHALELEKYELQKQKNSLLEKKGRLEQQQNKIKQRELEYEEQKKLQKSYQDTIDTYHALATAFGKDGIQALLIEEAIPEIEQEANQLISKLTDNRSHIIIESVRDLKKGGTKETLDIKISDPVGIRSYELFSGGEAFRIDFSLRIAISKLLARRAGTSLQTLIIDEGFGSQDEEGLSHIMDALYKIQDDFAKIIVVSHLPSMKDQFPVHFMIEKQSNGSTINIMHHG